MKTSTTWIAKNSIKSVLSVIRFGEMKTPDQEKNTKPLDIDSVLSEILYSESSLQDFFDKNHILIIPDSKLNLEFKSQNTKGFFVLSLIDNQKQNLIKSIKEILSAKRIAINNAQITKLVNHFYNYNNSISKNAGADYRVNSSDFVQK